MDNFNQNNKGRLDKIQEDLYKNEFQSEVDKRGTLDPADYNQLEKDWQDPQQPINDEPKTIDVSELPQKSNKKGIGFFGYILILSAIFFIAAISYAAFIFWGNNNQVSAEDVNINISGPVSVGAGEILSIDLIIQNNNPVQIEAIDVIIEYPNGTKSSQDLITDLRRTKERIEPIVAGEILRKNIDMVLFGEEGENKEIAISLEYQATGLNAIFNKKKVFSIVLSAAPVRVAVSALKEVSSGQEIELITSVISNSNTDLNNLLLTINYPFGFKFIEADLKPTFGENIWLIDTLKPKEEKKIKIKGTITGQNAEQRVFRFSTGLADENNNQQIGVIFNNFIHELTIQRPFVGLDLSINRSSNPVVSVRNKSKVDFELSFSNNTNDYVRNLDIRLNIIGSIFNQSAVKANEGFYRSIDNTLIFNRDTNSRFREILPRNRATTNFEITLFDLIKNNPNIVNPEIKINAFLEADRISINNVEEELKETFNKTIKVISDVVVGGTTQRNEGSFENTGPFPPKAEEETTYTIKWSVANTFNDIENARITAILPTYVTWNNRANQTGQSYSYDEKTRTIVWEIGRVGTWVGYNSDPKEMSFQVTLLPSLTQIKTAPTLVRNVFFSARDTFTGDDIQISVNDSTTKVSDSGAFKDHEIVIE